MLVQEQQLWQQYGNNEMQGQVGLANAWWSYWLQWHGSAPNMPYGLPPVNGMGQPGWYIITHPAELGSLDALFSYPMIVSYYHRVTGPLPTSFTILNKTERNIRDHTANYVNLQ